uniref:Uncharacterized protein n=1 Tax=Cricetulus griseus TaxID=10029 RepID=A0A8C2N018_CRIGR
MAAPETGGSENGAGRNTLPGTKGQVRFLRQPQPFSLPAGAERVDPLPQLRQRRQQSDDWKGKPEMRSGGPWSHFGRGRLPLRCPPDPLCRFLGVPAIFAV